MNGCEFFAHFRCLAVFHLADNFDIGMHIVPGTKRHAMSHRVPAFHESFRECFIHDGDFRAAGRYPRW